MLLLWLHSNYKSNIKFNLRSYLFSRFFANFSFYLLGRKIVNFLILSDYTDYTD